MRILIDLQSCQSGSRRRGIGRYAASMARAMMQEAGKRHKFQVLLSDLYPDDLLEIRRSLDGLLPNEEILVVSLPRQVASAMDENAWRTRAAELALAKVVGDLAPDIYFNPSLFEGFREPTVASIEPLGCQMATALYDLIPYSEPEAYLGDASLRRAYESKLASLQRCDVVFAISEFTRSEAIRLLDISPDRIVHVPLAASSEFVPAELAKDDYAQLLARYGISRRFVITTAPLEPRKNLYGLLAGFSRLGADLRANLQLVIVGQADPAARRKIAEVAAAEGLTEDEFVVAGFVPDQDLAALYSGCELMAFPSLSEGFGLPPLEAMACGAAVVVSNRTSLPEVVGRPDVLFDPQDPDDMARVMASVLIDRDHRQSLKAYSLARAAKYSWRKSARTLLAAFERLPRRNDFTKIMTAGFALGARVGVMAAVGPAGSPGATRLRSILHDLTMTCAVELAMVGGDIGRDTVLDTLPRSDPNDMLQFGARFDRILYVANADRAHRIVDYVGARTGPVIVLDADPAPYSGGRLSKAEQADLFAWGGFKALAAAMNGDQAPLEQAAGAALGGASLILAEPDSRLVRSGRAKALGTMGKDDATRGSADAILEALASAPLPLAREALSRLPMVVNGVRPTHADVAELALVVSKNAAVYRKPAFFLDLSGLKGAAGPRLSPLRRFLVDMLVGDAALRPVHFKGGQVWSANRLAGRLVGLSDFPVSDHEVALRPGDQIICLDMLGGADFDRDLLALLTARGVSISVAVVEDLLAERPDLSQSIALAVVDAAFSTTSSVEGKVIVGGGAGRQALKRSKRVENRPTSNGGARLTPNYLAPGGSERLDALRERYGALIPDHVHLAQSEAQARLRDDWGKAAPDTTPSVANYTIMGHVRGSYSLAMVNRSMARALDAELPERTAFVAFETAPVDDVLDVPVTEQATLARLMGHILPPDGADVVISHHYPVLPVPMTPDLAMALFHWEETAVPWNTIETLNRHFSAVLAPSSSVRKALIDSGLRIPLAHVGLPVDLSAFERVRRVRSEGGTETVFLHVSSCFPRKGVDLLLAAWRRAFAPDEAVRLIIKTFPNPHNDVEDQIVRMRRDGGDCAPIEVINSDLDQEALAALYGRADVVVLPSRGEGYNLPALEAMASGTPLIVTGHGGQMDFCSPREARLLDYVFAPSGSHVAGGHALWVEPSLADLALALREQIDPAHAETIEKRRIRAMEMATEIGCPKAWVERLQSVTADLLRVPSTHRPRTAWVTSWGVKCGIAEYSSFLLDKMPADARASTVVLSDRRTPQDSGRGLIHEAAWTIGGDRHLDDLLDAMERHDIEAVVIQHQDGLIRWTVLGELLQDERLDDRVVVLFLHVVRNIELLLTDDEREVALAGLRRATRIVVHNIADLNQLKSYGLVENVTLLPHGAMPGGAPPPVRALPTTSCPIIGCHGFFLGHKRVDRLIAALPALRRVWPGVKLRLVNANYPGESEGIISRCRALAEDLKVADAIEWHTDFLPVEDIVSLLSGCDLIVLPYDQSRDSASGAVRVAMSSLAPVLTTDVSIFAELGGVVAQVEGNEPEQLASAIEMLLKDSKRRGAVQRNMQDWLNRNAWGRVAETLDGMVQALFDARRRGWT